MDIAEAWNQMVERQPVLPTEVRDLVERIRNELIDAAPQEQPQPDGSVLLSFGVSVGPLDQRESEGGTVVSFTVSRRGSEGNRIVARCLYDGPPSVSDPCGLLTTWEENEDGPPQRAWILNSIRTHVVAFLSAI